MIQVLENSTGTHLLHTWCQWIAGFISFLTIEHQVIAAKHSFFFPLENFASKFPRLFLAAPEKPAVALVAEPAAGVDLEHSLFGFGQRCAILKPFFWRRHFL